MTPNLTPNLTPGSRSGVGDQRRWNPQPTPLLPIQVLSKAAAGLWREPPGPPNLCGSGSEHLMRESCRLARRTLGPWNPEERGGRAPVTPGRRLRTGCCGGNGFKAARFPSHVAPRAFYLGIAGTAYSLGASWARKLLPLLVPIAPYRLSAPKTNAVWALFGSLPA